MMRAFCSMVNFLSSFLPDLRRLLIPIYDIQKKSKQFKWTDEAEKAFNNIMKLLVNPPVLKAPTSDGLFRLELTGLPANIHGFMQLLCNRYFEVLVDHKAIEYMIKGKTESPTMRLKTLLLNLSEYTIDLKYQKGLEMHKSDALSQLQNIADTPDNKDVIPLNILQHLAPNYIEHTYSHLVENFYIHKTKSIDTTQVKRK